MMRKPGEVFHFIKKNTTIKEFYNFLTLDGTNFEYDINDRHYRNNWSALHFACYWGNLALAQALINMGANVNCYGDGQFTSLGCAIKYDHFNIVKLLIKNGANLDDQYGKVSSNNGYIELAIKEKRAEIAKYLIEIAPTSLLGLISNKLKFDPEFKQKSIESFEHRAKNNYKEILNQNLLDLIESRPSEFMDSLCDQYSAIKKSIENAVRDNNLKQLKKLLTGNIFYVDVCGLYLNGADSLTRVAAVEHGNFEMVKLLVENNDYIFESAHASGISIPNAARSKGHHKIAEYLENLQTIRYQRLHEEANRQERGRICMLGAFFDKGSNISQELVQKLTEEDAGNIARSIFRNM